MAEVFRGLTIALGGVAGGFCLASIWIHARAWRVQHRRLFAGIILMRLGTIGLTIFGVMAVAVRFGDPVSWRTPLAFVSFLLITAGLGGILHDNELRWLKRLWRGPNAGVP